MSDDIDKIILIVDQAKKHKGNKKTVMKCFNDFMSNNPHFSQYLKHDQHHPNQSTHGGSNISSIVDFATITYVPYVAGKLLLKKDAHWAQIVLSAILLIISLASSQPQKQNMPVDRRTELINDPNGCVRTTYYPDIITTLRNRIAKVNEYISDPDHFKEEFDSEIIKSRELYPSRAISSADEIFRITHYSIHRPIIIVGCYYYCLLGECDDEKKQILEISSYYLPANLPNFILDILIDWRYRVNRKITPHGIRPTGFDIDIISRRIDKIPLNDDDKLLHNIIKFVTENGHIMRSLVLDTKFSYELYKPHSLIYAITVAALSKNLIPSLKESAVKALFYETKETLRSDNKELDYSPKPADASDSAIVKKLKNLWNSKFAIVKAGGSSNQQMCLGIIIVLIIIIIIYSCRKGRLMHQRYHTLKNCQRGYLMNPLEKSPKI